MRLGQTAPALCPGLLALGRKDEKLVNGENERIWRSNVRKKKERRERKEKMTGEEEERWIWKKRQADGCLSSVQVDASIFSA